MGLTFEPLGKYVRLVDERNTQMVTESVLGINIDKYFMPSVANVIGTDLRNYKLLINGRFACNPMHVGRDGRLPVARYAEESPAIVSPAYFMFEVVNADDVDPEYLMLCFRNPDFDRMCWFRTDASVRGGITWEDVCALTIPVPPINEQRKIVNDYQVFADRIDMLQKSSSNLEVLCQALYLNLIGKEAANAKLGDIAEIASGRRPESMDEGNIPLLGAGGIMSYINQYNYDCDSLIIGRVGTHGVVQRSKRFWASDNTLVILPKYYEFVYQVLQKVDYSALNRGSTQPLITQGDMRALDIYIPPEKELARFEKAAGSIMKCFTNYQMEINILQKLSLLLITKLGGARL